MGREIEPKINKDKPEEIDTRCSTPNRARSNTYTSDIEANITHLYPCQYVSLRVDTHHIAPIRY